MEDRGSGTFTTLAGEPAVPPAYECMPETDASCLQGLAYRINRPNATGPTFPLACTTAGSRRRRQRPAAAMRFAGEDRVRIKAANRLAEIARHIAFHLESEIAPAAHA